MAYHNYYQGGYYPQYQSGAMPDMLNQYKGQYQQPMQMQQPIMQMPMQMPPQTNDMIWVLSEGEAQSYPVAPNNSVILWDKNSDVVYIKSVNAQNVPSFRVLEYKERIADNASKTPQKHECKCGGMFVSKKDFEELQAKFEGIESELEELRTKSKTKTAKKAVEEAEYGE